MTIDNRKLHLAEDYVCTTGCNVFLTGRAGTGKTTFLRSLNEKTGKRFIVTAPTGVAALNAGGVTLHSFFQIPLAPFVPGSESADHTGRHRFNREKIKIIRSLDLLVIDEISMVRADVLDSVDKVLQRHRRNSLPFGGVQLLMIGDLHQLPPVVKEADWQILRDFYDSAYFFSSRALGRTELVSIELEHIYRQSDPAFIGLLNRVRDNRLDKPSLDALNSRCLPDFVPDDKEGYITLCSHNRKVEVINEARLKALPAASHVFEAEVAGDFPEYSYPTPARLELKVGAQVMFVRNDSSPEKLYYNGKIGKIVRIGEESVTVKCPEDKEAIIVEAVTWENIKYRLDSETKEIRAEKMGTFVQVPLKPAWAITIHKSQGLTFEKAVIDAGAAFAPGQVYVALSRCKSMEGLVLSSPISPAALKSDAVVCRFVDKARRATPSPAILQAARMTYQQRLLFDCFDFGRLRFRFNRLVGAVEGSGRLITVSGVDDIRDLMKRAEAEITVIGENFSRQLKGLFRPDRLPEADEVIAGRLGKAAGYFGEKMQTILVEGLKDFRVETDNKEIAGRIRDARRELDRELAVKRAAVASCGSGFSIDGYLRAVATAEIDFEQAKAPRESQVEYGEADVAYGELFRILKDWRAEQAAEEGLPHYRILHQRILVQIAVNLPDTLTALLKIRGIGKRTAAKYGEALVKLVAAYRQKHGITEVELPPTPAAGENGEGKGGKPPRTNTRQISLDMFEEGLSIERIAEERGLVVSTVEGHLAEFVRSGELDINRLLLPEKQKAIAEKLGEFEDEGFKEIKLALGDGYTYGEIRMMHAHLRFLAKKEKGESDRPSEGEIA